MKLVVDTNVLISAIIKIGKTRQILFDFKFDFFTPAYTLTELNKHKNEICNKAGINEFEFSYFSDILFKYVKIIHPDFYSSFFEEASVLIKDVKDVPFLACAMALECGIWSNDKGFKKQTNVNIFTTKELIEVTKD